MKNLMEITIDDIILLRFALRWSSDTLCSEDGPFPDFMVEEVNNQINSLLSKFELLVNSNS